MRRFWDFKDEEEVEFRAEESVNFMDEEVGDYVMRRLWEPEMSL